MSTPPSEVSFKSYGGSAPENYERYFVPAIGAPFAADLVEAAALRPGERVLDVACGTGIVARLAADRVGGQGSVAGLDVNPGMLAVARSVAPPGTSMEWHEATAERMPLPDQALDVVLCSLGLPFIPDKVAALGEMHRVLAPGGRMAANAVGPIPPMFAALAEALTRHAGPEAGGFVEGVFSLHDPEELRELVSGAGFRDVEVQTRTLKLLLPAPNEFLWQYVRSSPLTGALEQVDDDRRAAIEREVVEAWRPFAQDDGVPARPRALIATARKS